MRYKETKAYLIEEVFAECPHCGAEWHDREPNWRNKPQEDGFAYYPVRCQMTVCSKMFKLKFYKQ